MSVKKTTLPDYWSIYKALNFKRFSTNREYVDKKTWKKMTYEFIGHDILKSSMFMQLFSGILWMSPVIVIIMVASCYALEYPAAYFYAILIIIAYHFAAMYYIIRGPYLVISEVKKKGIFSRK